MAPGLSSAVLAGCLGALASAVQLERPQLRGTSPVSSAKPKRSYGGDCFKRKPNALLAVPIPGAGVDPSAIHPFTEVFKDGYYQIDCVKDYLFEYGDKFGDNKASYKLGQISNVSIVHYAAHVPKEDRHEMTHETCFLFCRSVKDMLFFGITNGRECYCAPYYKAEAGDSSSCDAPCDGDAGSMCGGKSKSAIFGMHSCSDTLADLQDAAAVLTTEQQKLWTLLGSGTAASGGMQSLASASQATFGKAGDSAASDLLQTAKVAAGEIEAVVRRGSDLDTTLTALLAQQAGIAQAVSSAEIMKAEQLTRDIEDATGKAEELAKEMHGLLELTQRGTELATSSAIDEYYPLMYFVDQELEFESSTCSGVAAEKPIFASKAACARLCDEDHDRDCVGFSFFTGAAQSQQMQGPVSGLCFLMSKFQTAKYYTGCVDEAARDVKCFAKLSKFEGTSLAPKADGTCAACLKEVSKSSTCFSSSGSQGQQGGSEPTLG